MSDGTLLSRNDSTTSSKKKQFDFSRYPRRRIALLFLYLGWDYDGLVCQDTTTNTIEQAILDKMLATKMIESVETAKWSRSGRTDKGVSGFRQVASVTVRSTDVNASGVFWPPESAAEDARIKSASEQRFDLILNNVLPSDIRIIAWAPASDTFIARFGATYRSYVYFFPKGRLNIEAMQEGLSKLVGRHDFRNFCCIDKSKARLDATYVRDMFAADITPENDDQGPYQMYRIYIKASGFLWHQIRCIVSVIHEIGLGLEKPDLVSSLLDISTQRAKPQYNLAKDLPLCFFDTSYEDVDFDWKTNINADTLTKIYRQLEQRWSELQVKATMVRSMMKELSGFGPQQEDSFLGMEAFIRGSVRHKNYTPILKRPTGDSLETKIEKCIKRRRLKDDE